MSAVTSQITAMRNETAFQQNQQERTTGMKNDSNMFLTLMLKQLENQDPTEPTDNTEYVSQLATFSELEEMQNLNSSMGRQSASSLIGQYVYIEETDSTGNSKTAEGTVDYVTFSGGKTYLSIEGTLYNYDDLKTVSDSEYTLAVKLADTLVSEMNKLPALNNLTKDNLASVGNIVNAYSNMSNYQRSFMSDEASAVYNAYAQWYMKQTTEADDADSSEEAIEQA